MTEQFAKVRCGTPTPRGACNRWQFEVSADIPPGYPFRFRCSHCKEVTVLWSSQISIPVGLR